MIKKFIYCAGLLSIIVVFLVLWNRFRDNAPANAYVEISPGAVHHTIEEWTVKDNRPSGYDGAYVQIAVLGKDGKPLRLSYIALADKTKPKLAGFGDMLQKEESIIVALLEVAPKQWTDPYVIANKTYSWDYGVEGEVHLGGQVTIPPLKQNQKRHVIELRPKAPPDAEAGVPIVGTLPPGCPMDESFTVGYFIDGQAKFFYPTLGQRDFKIRVPAYGGELVVASVATNIAVIYQTKVIGSNIGVDSYRAFRDARKYKVLFKADEKPTIVDFVEHEHAKFPLGGARIKPGADSVDVYLVPGRYWVRRFESGPSRDYNVAPIAQIEVGNQEVLDFSGN